MVEEGRQGPSRNHPRRPVCFDPESGHVDTPIRARATLRPGEMVQGPVIIEEYGSTIPIHPGFTVEVDDFRNLVVTRIEEGDL